MENESPIPSHHPGVVPNAGMVNSLRARIELIFSTILFLLSEFIMLLVIVRRQRLHLEPMLLLYLLPALGILPWVWSLRARKQLRQMARESEISACNEMYVAYVLSRILGLCYLLFLFCALALLIAGT